MGRGIFGWDLPPGVRLSDIPGNRPEDDIWETIYDNFWNKERLTKTHIGTLITEEQYEKMDNLYEQNNPNFADEIDAYISAAIEYGMEIGQQQEKDSDGENKYYLSMYHEQVRNPKLRSFFKEQRKRIKEFEDRR